MTRSIVFQRTLHETVKALKFQLLRPAKFIKVRSGTAKSQHPNRLLLKGGVHQEIIEIQKRILTKLKIRENLINRPKLNLKILLQNEYKLPVKDLSQSWFNSLSLEVYETRLKFKQ